MDDPDQYFLPVQGGFNPGFISALGDDLVYGAFGEVKTFQVRVNQADGQVLLKQRKGLYINACNRFVIMYSHKYEIGGQ
jgi:hypothetical protein